MSEPRKARLRTNYEGKNISEQINEDLEEFTYTDVASGESDSIEITLNDMEQKWMGPWMPQKGDRIQSTIEFFNWFMDGAYDLLECGDFEVDDISYSGRPFLCKIGAASIPQNSAFHAEKRTKTWENATVQIIATEIAQTAGIELFYDAEPVEVVSSEQNEQTDCEFLYSLCEEYGLAMKVFANKIIIFDEERYEQAEAPTNLYEKDMISWTYNTTVAGTYTGASFSFSDPDTDQEYNVMIGGGDRIYEINVTADNMADAERKATAMLNNENKKSITMEIRMKANPGMCAGTCVILNGFAALDGKYYIEKIRTTVSGNNATQMNLSIRKVIERIKASSQGSSNEETGGVYEVKGGDTLWQIAKEKLGAGTRYVEIYNLNKETIESAAKAHGFENSDNGHWIFPGTKLILPA